MRDLNKYPFEIVPLSAEDGGGFLISFPDFSECISDGETIEEAVRNGMDALQETIAALESMGLPVPEPGNRLNSVSLPSINVGPNVWNLYSSGMSAKRRSTWTSMASVLMMR